MSLLVDLGRQVPFGLRDVGEELGERLPDPVLASEDSLRRDEDRVVRVVRDDPLELLGSEGFRVMLEDLPWAPPVYHRFLPPRSYGIRMPRPCSRPPSRSSIASLTASSG
jgi:hypothetical protein